MKIAMLVLALILSTPPALAGESPAVIDGTTEETFSLSHARVVEQLSPEDRYRFALAELVMLSDYHCLQPKTPPSDDFVSRLLGGEADLASCRRELHGLTAAGVMARAYPDASKRPTDE